MFHSYVKNYQRVHVYFTHFRFLWNHRHFLKRAGSAALRIFSSRAAGCQCLDHSDGGFTKHNGTLTMKHWRNGDFKPPGIIYIYYLLWGFKQQMGISWGEWEIYIYINITLCATVLADLNSLRRAAPERISVLVEEKISPTIMIHGFV